MRFRTGKPYVVVGRVYNFKWSYFRGKLKVCIKDPYSDNEFRVEVIHIDEHYGQPYYCVGNTFWISRNEILKGQKAYAA